ncbi:MAG: imidazole glycerol phosphate synthase subunit HisF [Candidatus Lokiarchaeota archaeon]|nr:imidazole glycerol phosphate synthase subunit HisF [Candidatus Lokiarchaeota archaeon]
MLNYKKIIPCLDVKEGRVVKGIQFVNLKDAGDPVEFGRYYEEEGADELVFLDITATVEKRKTVVELVKKVANGISIPFTVGGGIGSLEDVQAILDAGADKISLNTAAVNNPDLLAKISKEYGPERLVCAIDGNRVYVEDKKDAEDKTLFEVENKYCWFDVMTHGGRKSTGMDAIQWAKKTKELGVGEILPTSKTYDGTKKGYDIEMTRGIAEATGLPVTASGGAGSIQHILDAFTKGKASAALAASIFHFREITIKDCKQYCVKNGINMRL